MTMKWHRISDTAMRCDPWTIAYVVLDGKDTYELWHDKQPARVGAFESARLAADEAERIELAGQA